MQPDAVMVQTNPEWWQTAQMLQFVDSQEEFNNYGKHLDKYTQLKSFNMYNPTRAGAFWARFYMYCGLWRYHF